MAEDKSIITALDLLKCSDLQDHSREVCLSLCFQVENAGKKVRLWVDELVLILLSAMISLNNTSGDAVLSNLIREVCDEGVAMANTVQNFGVATKVLGRDLLYCCIEYLSQPGAPDAVIFKAWGLQMELNSLIGSFTGYELTLRRLRDRLAEIGHPVSIPSGLPPLP
jgi:hypothetical protein